MPSNIQPVQFMLNGSGGGEGVASSPSDTGDVKSFVARAYQMIDDKFVDREIYTQDIDGETAFFADCDVNYPLKFMFRYSTGYSELQYHGVVVGERFRPLGGNYESEIIKSSYNQKYYASVEYEMLPMVYIKNINIGVIQDVEGFNGLYARCTGVGDLITCVPSDEFNTNSSYDIKLSYLNEDYEDSVSIICKNELNDELSYDTIGEYALPIKDYGSSPTIYEWGTKINIVFRNELYDGFNAVPTNIDEFMQSMYQIVDGSNVTRDLGIDDEGNFYIKIDNTLPLYVGGIGSSGVITEEKNTNLTNTGLCKGYAFKTVYDEGYGISRNIRFGSTSYLVLNVVRFPLVSIKNINIASIADVSGFNGVFALRSGYDTMLTYMDYIDTNESYDLLLSYIPVNSDTHTTLNIRASEGMEDKYSLGDFSLSADANYNDTVIEYEWSNQSVSN